MIATREHHGSPSRHGPRAVINFGWHFAEMCAAMCVAWMVVTMPFIGIARMAGTSDPLRDWPEVATLLAVVAMSAGMAAQMRWRRHGWRCIAEMAAAMGLDAVVVFSLAAAEVLPRSDQFAWFHALMPAAMVTAMLLRRDLYTGPVAVHGRAHVPDGEASERSRRVLTRQSGT